MENTQNKTATQSQVATTKEAQPYKSALTKVQDVYMPMIQQSMADYKLVLDNYQNQCMLGAIGKIQELLANNQLAFKDIDSSNVAQILTTVATLKLNPTATPRECYFQLRNVKVGDTYKKVIEMGIEGSGNDAILRNYGVDVKSVMTPFLVREGDEFSLPYFDGEKMQPLTWKMKSLSSKVIMVVYVITKTDGTREYAMADRESVADNLKAHIINNLRSVPEQIKNPILAKIENMKLDEMLNDLDLRKKIEYTAFNKTQTTNPISPAWTQPSSREAMIERKMRNNAIKKYPKNFDNALAQNGYESTYEDYEQYREKKENKNPVDVVEAEFNEKQATTPTNPVIMPNSSRNEQIVHNEPKNEQINEDTQDTIVDDLPY